MDTWILPTIISVLTSLIGFLIGRIKEKNKADKALKHGIQAVLRYSMLMMYQQAKTVGTVTIEDKNTFENMYTQYHLLGANGVMGSIHQEYIQMEIRNE